MTVNSEHLFLTGLGLTINKQSLNLKKTILCSFDLIAK